MYKLSDILILIILNKKRKILSNFPITREDRNKTLNELVDSSGGGGTRIMYFKVSEDAELDGDDSSLPFMYGMYEFYSTSHKLIVPAGLIVLDNSLIPRTFKGVKFSLIYTDKPVVISGLTINRGDFYSFIDNVLLNKGVNAELIDKVKKSFIPITEEEFYKID